MSIHENIRKMMAEQRAELMNDEKQLTDFELGIQSGLTSVFGIDSYIKRDYLKEAKGWIYGCVNVIADEIAGTQFFLRKENNGEVEEIHEHDALDLLYRANNVTTQFDLIKLTFQYLEQTGEAPWFISFKNSKPDSIILLRPDRLTVMPGKNGELVGGYKYKVFSAGGGFKEVELEPFEVIPLRYTDPDSPLRGKGPLQAAQDTVDLDRYSEQWNKNFFKNSASPHAAIETDKVLSKESREKLSRRLKEHYQSYENAHKTMILENGLKFKSLNLSQKDMDFIEQQRFSRDKIMAIFRVPRTALGITDDVNRANAEATDYVFAKRTIKPKLEGFVQQLTEFLLPLFPGTEKMYFEYADPVPENIELKLKVADGVQKGWMTVNEARELFGLDPVEGGDEIRDPLGFAPLLSSQGNSLKSKPKAKEKVSPKRLYQLKARNKKKKKVDEFLKHIKTTITEKITPIIFSALKKKIHNGKEEKIKKAKVFWTGTPEEIKAKKIEFQVIQLRIGAKFEKMFKPKLDTVFAEQKKHAVDLVEGGSTEINLNPATWTRRYIKLLTPIYKEVIRQQSREAFRVVGQDDELLPEKTRSSVVSDYLKNHVFELSLAINRTTNDLLGAALAAGVKAGEGIPELSKRVRELFDDMEKYRSDRIARTEVIDATSFASEEAYVESEVVEGKEWLTTLDDRTDGDCADLDGKVVKLGEDFGEVDNPPLHPNCRCTIIPVVL